MSVDQTALEHIKELEAQLDEQAVVIALLREDLAESQARSKVLQGQLERVLIDRRYVVA